MSQFPAPDAGWTRRLMQPYALYAGLARSSAGAQSLGGRLVWAGGLNENGCDLMRAANVAGAASLGSTDDPQALRHANRDGVADFLVTSLDEALRILKNEVRKRQPVSVGIAAAPQRIAEEMEERGVLPDLIAPRAWAIGADWTWPLANGAQAVEAMPLPPGWTFQAWAALPAGFEEQASHLLAGDELNGRWLRLSPRYLGPAARRVRSLACSTEVAARLSQFAAS